MYIGAVMGAGFATGQELMRYFVRFGVRGLLAIFVCGLIFALVGFKVLYFMHLNELNGYREFLHCIMGKRFGMLAEIVSFCFIIALYSAMLAAVSALGNSLWDGSGVWLSVAAMLICTALVTGGVHSLGAVNLILGPLLVGGSIVTGLWLYFGSVEVFAPASGIDDNLFGSAVVYISYNMISCVGVLCAVSKKIDGLRDALVGAAVSGAVIGLAGLALALPVYKYFSSVSASELPILSLTANSNLFLHIGYVTVLAAAIFTTALGNCYCAVECLDAGNGLKRLFWSLVVGIAALAMARIGFQSIVERLYYVFGCLGIAEVCAIICLRLKRVG